MLEWDRAEDAADLERSELNELVENWRYLTAFEGEIWKSDQMVVMDEKLVQTS